MFGRRKSPRTPPGEPFVHGEGCKTSAASPEWEYEGGGSYRRMCGCRVERWQEPQERWRPGADKFVHGADCPGLDTFVRVEEVDGSAGHLFKLTCVGCPGQARFVQSPVASAAAIRAAATGDHPLPLNVSIGS